MGPVISVDALLKKSIASFLGRVKVGIEPTARPQPPRANSYSVTSVTAAGVGE